MFEGSCFGKRLVSLAERDIEGGASDGDAAPRVIGPNTLPEHRSRDSPCGRRGGRGGRGCGHRDGLFSGDGAGAAGRVSGGVCGCRRLCHARRGPLRSRRRASAGCSLRRGRPPTVRGASGRSGAGDVVVVARESEPFRVTADEGCHGKVLVRARGRTVDDNQINVAHDCTKNELIMAVSTVMMNWIMVFQRFMSLKIFIRISDVC